MSRTFGKNCLVTAILLNCSRSSCLVSVVSSSSSQYRVVLGILSKTTGISLSLAATLGKWSANSFPILRARALIHKNSIVHLELLSLINVFLISCIR